MASVVLAATGRQEGQGQIESDYARQKVKRNQYFHDRREFGKLDEWGHTHLVIPKN